mgnify:FL=1
MDRTPLSHSQLVRYCHRFGLLAMLLLLLGPLLGQGLSHAAEPSWYAELACGSQHQSSSSIEHGQDWAECGYCTLLLGSPAVLGCALQVPPHLPQPSPKRLPEPRLTSLCSVFPGALTRAPPVS